MPALIPIFDDDVSDEQIGRDKILILDFGSQVTQLIARRIREAGVYCEIQPFHWNAEKITAFNPAAIILSGGPASVLAADSPRVPPLIFELGVPILGICYGQQAMCAALGGVVEPGGGGTGVAGEFGRAEIEITAASPLFNGIWRSGQSAPVWMSHGDRIRQLPPGFTVIASSENAPFAIIADEARGYYGTMFHPEVVHTPDGAALLANFALNIAKCRGDWTMASFREAAIAKLRGQIGDGRVICGLSGGVDSSVAAVLLHEAIGDQLTCVFVDTGLLREGEAADVVRLFRDHYQIRLIDKSSGELFLARLAGISDPEAKRKIIGATFIDVFVAAAAEIGGAEFLAQGTLYPDVIESVSVLGGPSVTIKSHHNVGGLPEKMDLKLVEPLRELFKDEVRALGRTLGLPAHFIGRHPFPGPGLAIRIPGEVTPERLKILRAADRIYIEEIRAAGLYDVIWQAFAVLLPVRTVGVMGDARSYDYACALRAVTSTDGMTADYYPFRHEFLGRVATRIVNEAGGINRVTYDITAKPPGTIEWE